MTHLANLVLEIITVTDRPPDTRAAMIVDAVRCPVVDDQPGTLATQQRCEFLYGHVGHHAAHDQRDGSNAVSQWRPR